MPGINPLVQRSLAARGSTAQPTQTLDQARLAQQFQQQQQAWQQGVATASPTPTSTTTGAVPSGVDIDRILRTIRQRESGGNYSIKNPHSSASGAYQFIDSTWGGYGGYRHAWQAPQEVQDRKAREHVLSILGRYNNDLWAVPAAWYTGSYRGRGNLNYNPGGPGNPLTVQQYVDRWLADYNAWG